MPFNKGKYDTEYNMTNVTRKFIPFNKNNPEDVALLEWVNAKGKGKVTEYIKSLIREDMKKKGKSEPLPYLIIEVIDIDDTSEGHTFEKYCPSCGIGFGHFYPPKFCPKCGQHIAEEGVLKETKTIDNRTKKRIRSQNGSQAGE